MTSLRRFTCNDLFTYNNVNLDILTETYNLPFYLQYLAKWPEYCLLAEGPGKQAMGYILGKAEGSGTQWHGHVTAVTVAPDFRRQNLARKLMAMLEEITHKVCLCVCVGGGARVCARLWWSPTGRAYVWRSARPACHTQHKGKGALTPACSASSCDMLLCECACFSMMKRFHACPPAHTGA